jgi:hypothetical protein
MKSYGQLAGTCVILVALFSLIAGRGGAQQTPPPYPAQQCGTGGGDATIIGRLPSKASSAYYGQDSVSGYPVGSAGAKQYLLEVEAVASPTPVLSTSTTPPTISTTALTQSLEYANFQPSAPGKTTYQFTCHSMPRNTTFQFIATIYQPFNSCDSMGNVMQIQLTYYYIAQIATQGTKNFTGYINPSSWTLIGTHPTLSGGMIPTPPCYPPGSTPGP